ncbi:MAG: hypothetical protein JWN93_1929 [Hyphomicrobiales bacterium]|nr:hypothetical protein [Hyphomicrobiales bacterium]
MGDEDRFQLGRFVAAQKGVYETALEELKAGRKRSHWMWFVFPQLCGLGRSHSAEYYGLRSLEEARAYLRHPTLGPRLARCVEAVLQHEGAALCDIFGPPDDLKFRSSMTLFAQAAPDPGLFEKALQGFCGGAPDAATLSLLARR